MNDAKNWIGVTVAAAEWLALWFLLPVVLLIPWNIIAQMTTSGSG